MLFFLMKIFNLVRLISFFFFQADNLKDLLRFLRRDDPQNRDVFKQVCRWNTVSKDLIPIIEHCQDDRNLVLNAGKLVKKNKLLLDF